MNYYCVSIKFNTPKADDTSEIIAAWLSEIGFLSFSDTDEGLEAFIPENDYEEALVTRKMEWIHTQIPIAWQTQFIVDKNWNEEWEKNYQPVLIDGRCQVRAPFHPPDPAIDFDLIIEPKMSFGTAHHETTRMMIGLILASEWQNKVFLDMGCGTGVLAVLAAKMGAKSGLAIDNDTWAYENTKENLERNMISNVAALLGDEQLIEGHQFDVILANINRNILLQQIPAYLKALKPGGKIFMSGFYEEDVPVLLKAFDESGLKLLEKRTLNNWSAVVVG
jgi:ribosomal protein L11 methyltransferase